ncbi:MAG TPA: putative O-glycosylation ligase, exosortase A system-associated, partial [Allosphingosinicella sp.]
YRREDGDKAWIAPLATALQHFQIVYMVGSSFIAIAFQPFVLMMVGVQIGFDLLVTRREKAERPRRSWASSPALPAAKAAGA